MDNHYITTNCYHAIPNNYDLCLTFQMTRKQVNDYKIGRSIPYFSIHLKSDRAVPQTLEQKIELKGVKDANYITILREPDSSQGLYNKYRCLVNA